MLQRIKSSLRSPPERRCTVRTWSRLAPWGYAAIRECKGITHQAFVCSGPVKAVKEANAYENRLN